MEEKTVGILLQTIPYLGVQKILKIFTPNTGVISLMAKRASFAPVTVPFLLAEWVYRPGKGEIHLLHDATLLDDWAALRNSYATLFAAGAIAQDLLRSQLPAKKGSGLYALTLSYLQKLPAFPSPNTLVASFRIKLLLHEGLLALQPDCTHCGIAASHLSEGESTCASHAGMHSIAFTKNEWEALHTLAYARQFSLLQTVALAEATEQKIGVLLEERIR